VPENAAYEKAHQTFGELIRLECYYPLHITLIRDDGEATVAGAPKCEICLLPDVCQ
jgi:hypothetical protein